MRCEGTSFPIRCIRVATDQIHISTKKIIEFCKIFCIFKCVLSKNKIIHKISDTNVDRIVYLFFILVQKACKKLKWPKELFPNKKRQKNTDMRNHIIKKQYFFPTFFCNKFCNTDQFHFHSVISPISIFKTETFRNTVAKMSSP